MRVLVLLVLLTLVHGEEELVRLEPDVKTYDVEQVVHGQWRLVDGQHVDVDVTMDVHLLLRVHEDKLMQRLDDVSMPKSPEYGKYLSVQELAELTRVPDEDVRVVRDWVKRRLGEQRDVRLLATGDVMVLEEARVDEVERLFKTRLGVFEHGEVGKRLVRATAPLWCPKSVAKVVQVAGELLHFPLLRRVDRVDEQPDGKKEEVRAPMGGQWENDCKHDVVGLQCEGWITPEVVRTAYNWDKSTLAKKGSNNSVAAVEFDGGYYDEKDLSGYSSACAIEPAVTISRVIGGPNKPAVCADYGCSESLADIELIGAMAPGVPMTWIYYEEYQLLSWLTNLSTIAHVPLVQSLSYGLDEDTQGADFIQRVNSEFAKAGLRGVTIVVSSGDSGTYGRSGPPDFHPTFPASSPMVLTVGGTFFTNNRVGEETATGWSGGGFSGAFAQPKYQRKAVESYLQAAGDGLPPAHLFNRSNRAFPDIAALSGSANPYCVFLTGMFTDFRGTSASAPTLAGLLAWANERRLQAGKSALGFVNPLVYELLETAPEAFNDVTRGNNAGDGDYGFDALQGWDPATGVGSLNFGAFVKAAMAL